MGRAELSCISILAICLCVDAAPKWWPSSVGQLAEEADQRADMDKRLNEVDAELVKTNMLLSVFLRGLQVDTTRLDMVNDMNMDTVVDISEDLAEQLDEIRKWKESQDNGFSWGAKIAKAVMTGDPTLILTGIMTLLLGGTSV